MFVKICLLTHIQWKKLKQCQPFANKQSKFGIKIGKMCHIRCGFHIMVNTILDMETFRMGRSTLFGRLPKQLSQSRISPL